MRQVPNYLIIGNGRCARHFQHYFSLLSLPFLTWQRTQSLTLLNEKLLHATHVLVLISDAAINKFINDHLRDSNALRIHFSGSLASDMAYGAHPLMTFSSHLYELAIYQSIPFVIDDDAPDFEKILPGLANPHIKLNKTFKEKYHALCVLSGNFTAILWQKFFNSLQCEFNIPIEFGYPYLRQQMANLLTNPTQALTGPLARGDKETLAKNIAALENDPFQEIYQSFVNCYKQIRSRGAV